MIHDLVSFQKKFKKDAPSRFIDDVMAVGMGIFFIVSLAMFLGAFAL